MQYDEEICESIITVSVKNNNFSAIDDVMLPNHRLSKLLLSALSSSSPLSLNRPGPYIITVVKPISFGSSDIVNIFYIDLTNVHPTAYPEVVLAYKTALETDGLEGIKKLESLRLSLLYLALDLNDSIGFAKAAYAETKDVFTDSK